MQLISVLLCASLVCKQMELYIYWDPDAKGDALFSSGLGGMIKEAVAETGWEIRSWEKERYWPRMVPWNKVESWQELKWRLGFDLPDEGTADLWIFWNLGASIKKWDFSRLDSKKMVLFLWEPPSVEPSSFAPETLARFSKVFTWDDDLVDNVKFFKFHYPVLRGRIDEIPSFASKKFCTLIASRLNSKYPQELYSARLKTARFFEDKPDEFDLYGKNWGKKKLKNWRGTIPDKLSVLKNYKFSICYENTQGHKGYITEKIFDCFAAGCVPVYWGAPNVTDYIPAEAFIDRRQFKDDAELYAFLKSITPEQYERYLDAAAAYLKSEKAQLFTSENFVRSFASILAQ